MCNNCKGNLKLISYKWNDEEMIYRYQCKNCKEEIIITKKRNDEELKEMMFDHNLYNNL